MTTRHRFDKRETRDRKINSAKIRRASRLALAVMGVSAGALAHHASAVTTYNWTSADTTGLWNSGSTSTDWKSATYPNSAGIAVEGPNGSGQTGTVTLNVNATVGEIKPGTTSGGAYFNVSGISNTLTFDGTGLGTNDFGDSNVAEIGMFSSANTLTVNTNIAVDNTNLDIGINNGNSTTLGVSIGTLGSTTISNTGSSPLAINVDGADKSGQNDTTVLINSAIGTSGGALSVNINTTDSLTKLWGAIGNSVTTVNDNGATRLFIDNTGNAFTGSLTIAAGANTTLAASYESYANGQFIPIGANTSVVVDNGTLELSGNSQGVDGLTGTGTVTNSKWDGAIGGSAVTLTVGYNNASAEFSGTIVGASGRTIALTKTGTGTQIFNNSGFTLTGSVLISGGTLQIGDGTNATASIGTNAITDNANLAYQYNGAVTITNVIGGTGTVSQLGSAPLTLNAANTFSGGLNINSSSVLAGSASTGVFGSGTVTMAAGTTLDLSGNSQSTGLLSSTATSAVVTNGGGSNATLTTTGPVAQSFAGVMQDGTTNTFGLTKAGAGVQTLTGISTYSGTTTINAGSLLLSPGSGLGNTAITVNSGGTFSPHPGSGTISLGATSAGSLGATLTLNPGTGSNVGGFFDMVDGAIGTVDLNQQSGFSGTALTLGGGGSSTNAPILSFDLGSASADELVVSTGSVSVGQTGAIIDVSVLSGVTSLSTGNYTLISAPGGGLSPLNLSATSVVLGTQSYSLSLANSTSTAEILTVGINTTTPLNAYWTGSNGTSWSSSGPTSWATSHTGATSTSGIPGGGTNVFMTADGASSSNLSTTLDSAFNINLLTFTGTGTTAATTSVTIAAGNGGSLELMASDSFQTSSGTTYGPGIGLLVQTGSAAHTISAPVILGASQTWEIDNSSANPLTVSGVISDGGLGYSLTKTGAGELVLSSSNTYGGLGGSTNVTAGTLVAAATGALPANLALIVNGGTLDLDGFSQSISSLSDGGASTGSIIDSGGAATLNTSSSITTTYSGTINASNATLGVDGSVSMTLAGVNTLSNLTQTAGTLNLSAANTINNGVAVNGGTLTVALTGSISGGSASFVNIGDSGNMTVNGGAITVANFYTNSKGTSATVINSGSTIIISGTLAVDSDNGAGGASYVELNGGMVTTGSITVGRTGFNSGGGTIVTAGQTGEGVYVLNGTINDTGTLYLGTNGATNSDANVRMDGGVLNVSGATVITDAGNTRLSTLDVNGGTFTTPSVQIGGNAGAAVGEAGELLVRGTGVANVGAITFGNAEQTTGPNVLNLLGGTLLVGSGGVVNNSTVTPAFNLGGGTYATAPVLAASAPWSSSVGITLTNSNNGTAPTIDAANATGGAVNITLSGAIGGAGGLIKTGAGTLTLTAGNFYTGITNINAGILNINGQYALGGTVYTGSAFNGGTLQYATAFSNNGTGDITQNSLGAAQPVTIKAGGATIDTNGNSITFASPLGNNGTGSLTVMDSSETTGSLTLSAADTYTGGTIVQSGILILASSGALPPSTSLNVASGALVTIANHSTNATYVPVASSLTNSGTIDITNNALIVHNGSIGAISAQIATAYNNGAWNGTNAASGIITSSTAANDTTHLTAVGVATGLTTFEGQTVNATDVLVKYTYYGDADLSGIVDGTDYSRIDNGFLMGLTGWYNGDFNYDGVINGSDYTLIDNAYNTQGAQIDGELASPTALIAGATGSSSVPEPATLGLLGIGAVGLLGRRRRGGVR